MRISDWSSDVCSSDLADAHSNGFPSAIGRLQAEDAAAAVLPAADDLGRRPVEDMPADLADHRRQFVERAAGRDHPDLGPDAPGAFSLSPGTTPVSACTGRRCIPTLGGAVCWGSVGALVDISGGGGT